MKEYVRTILDYPVKGIQFRDITTLLQNANHFYKAKEKELTTLINRYIKNKMTVL